MAKKRTITPLMTRADVAERLATTTRNLDRMVREGRFPRADCVLGRSPRWKAETVEAWIGKSG